MNKRVAVVCSWFDWYPPLSKITFSICCILSPLLFSEQLCFNMSNSCLKSVHMEKAAENYPQGILGRDTAKHQLVCAKLISLTDEALQSIKITVYTVSEESKVDLTHMTVIGDDSVTQT